MTTARIVTLVQMARLGDLAQTWLLISRLQHDGNIVKLVVEEKLTGLAALMVGDHNVIGVDTTRLRGLASGGRFSGELNKILGRLESLEAAVVINLNFHPAIAALAEAIPADVHAGARWSDVIKSLPTDEVFRELFSAATGDRRGGRHLSEIWGAYSSASSSNKPIAISPQLDESTAELLVKNGMDHDARPVAIIVGAGLMARAFPPEAWGEVARDLSAIAPVVLVGSAHEAASGEKVVNKSGGKVVNLCGLTDVVGLAGLLAGCRLVIGTDTGPLQVAAVMGASCLGIYYGSMYYRQTGPYGAHNIVIIPDSSDYPCSEAEMERSSRSIMLPPVNLVSNTAQFLLMGRRPDSLTGWKVLTTEIRKNGLVWNDIGEGNQSLPRIIPGAERNGKQRPQRQFRLD